MIKTRVTEAILGTVTDTSGVFSERMTVAPIARVKVVSV
jgi:hypothetical protein